VVAVKVQRLATDITLAMLGAQTTEVAENGSGDRCRGRATQRLSTPPEIAIHDPVVPAPEAVLQGLSQSIIDQAMNCQILAGINDRTARGRAVAEEGLEVYRCDVRKLVAYSDYLKDVVGQQNSALVEILGKIEQCEKLEELAGTCQEIEKKIRLLQDLSPPTLRHLAFEGKATGYRKETPGDWVARELDAPPPPTNPKRTAEV